MNNFPPSSAAPVQTADPSPGGAGGGGSQLLIDWDRPRAAARDPQTSHAAAERIKASGVLGQQAALVLSLVRRYPGHTSAELAARHADAVGGHWAVYRPMVARRLPELLGVRQGATRQCNVCESPSVTWWPL
jgi:hypothetical protein